MHIYPLIFNSMLIFNISVVFLTPYILSQCWKWATLLSFIDLCMILVHSAAITISRIWKKVLMSSDHTLDFTDMGKRTYPNVMLVYFQKFGLIVDDHYALFRAPNAYRDILMRIFTPCLIFQCVFNDFQCVITLLRALSVALLYVCNMVHLSAILLLNLGC